LLLVEQLVPLLLHLVDADGADAVVPLGQQEVGQRLLPEWLDLQ